MARSASDIASAFVAARPASESSASNATDHFQICRPLNDAVLDSATFQADLRTCGVARLSRVSIPSGIARSRKGRCNSPMGGPTRRRIFGDRVSGAKISAVFARERARKAAREADAAKCLLWSEQMEGFGGPAQPSPHDRAMPQWRIPLARG
jgi:hypothetical protein